MYEPSSAASPPGIVGGLCGIAAYIGYGAPRIVYELLLELQHRGHEAAAVAYLAGSGFSLEGGAGLVYEAIRAYRLPASSRLAVGHVRYSTSGPYGRLYQPLVVDAGGVELAVAFNGNIVNYREIDPGAAWDAEAVAKLLASLYREEGSLADALRGASRLLRGSYALVAASSKGELAAIRDPHGIRPAAYSLGDGYAAVASETAALEALGMEARELARGEMLYCNGLDCSVEQATPPAEKATCIFEYIYFARPDSVIDGVEVYKARLEMGRLLARIDPIDPDIVAPVPDSGRAAAAGYALEKAKPLLEVLYPSRFRGRAFILPPGVRAERVAKKYGVLRSTASGARIALIDDSIVRGSTASRIVAMLRTAGAREVHFRSASPPVVCPCPLGIDFPRPSELIARGKSIEEIRGIIGADTLIYNTVENVRKAAGGDGVCDACFTCRYPRLTEKYVKSYTRD